jgi:hypothetical protein
MMRSTAWLAAAIGSLIVGVVAYNAGLSQGAAQAAAAAGNLPPYAYGWHRPWGFGFGFPIFLLFFWFVLARGLFWGGPWRRHAWHRDGDVPRSFDDWHRRAHEQMGQDGAPKRV